MTALQTNRRGIGRSADRYYDVIRLDRERFKPESFYPVVRRRKKCLECAPRIDPLLDLFGTTPAARNRALILRQGRTSKPRAVHGRSLGLSKNELNEAETRAFLKFIAEADSDKSPYQRKIRMLPSDDD